MKILLSFMLIGCLSTAGFAQQYICQPYYGTNKLRFYNKTNPVTGSPFYTLDLATDVATTFGVGGGNGVNDVLIYNNKLFVSFDFGNSGGVLIYNFSDVYPSRTANAPIVIKPGGNTGNSSAGMAINPSNGDLYIATFHNSPNDGGVYKYTAASNYATGSQFSSYNNDASVAFICANLTFDSSGNLWMTTWDFSTAANAHFLICYKASGGVLSKNNFYKITNAASASYSATDINGAAHNSLHVLSAPEGIIFDSSGNLWLGNNNDGGANTNPVGQGTLVKVNAAGIASILANAANGSTFTIPAGNTDIKYISNAKLGGIAFDGNTLYINDQGQNQGSSYLSNGTVWKWDISTTFNTSNFVASGIYTTYPGNGGMALVPCSLIPTANPTSASANPSTISSGQTTVLTASGCAAGTTYVWKNGNLVVSTSASFTTPALNSNTTYTAYCANGDCQSTGTNVVVTVNNSSCLPPTLSAAAITPINVMPNNEIHTNRLTATDCAGTVTWNTGSTNTAITVPAALSASSTYTATCTLGTCVSTAASITLNYISPPNISATPSTLCEGQNATFTAMGCVGTVSWYRYSGGTKIYTNIGTGTPLSYPPQQGTPLNPISYVATCIVGGQSSGLFNSLSFTIIQTSAVTSASANPSTINAGNTSTLTASGCSSGATYMWTNNSIVASTSASFTTPVLNVTTTYTVYCVNNNGTCQSTGTDVIITVNSTEPCPETQYLDGLVTPGPFSPNQIIQASNEIIAGNGIDPLVIDVNNSNNLTLRAGKSITISPGITVANGAVFKVEIGGCGSTTMQVNGRFLYDANNQKIILVGANLPLLDDWNFPTSDKLTELEKTGANAVRIEWYINYGQPSRPAYSLTDLDNFLTKCKNNRMIPILDLHDFTCGSDISVLNAQAIPWWTSAPVLTVLNKHKKYLIINLANELGIYRWAGDNSQQATALTNFKNAYKTAITSIRNAGLDVPIMIDAPDCGTTIGAFNTIGAELITHDPKHNLLLSAHAYWAGYNGTSEISTTISNNLPIVFGEVANKQSEGNDQCYYDLDGTNENHPPILPFTYQSLLNTCQSNQIGWLAWSWFPDGCASRNMSSTGNYANLTTFGSDVVNNVTYGIKNKAIRRNGF